MDIPQNLEDGSRDKVKYLLSEQRDRDVKVTKLSEVEDIEVYLTMFDCFMAAYDIL